jgi:hypothetical protein
MAGGVGQHLRRPHRCRLRSSRILSGYCAPRPYEQERQTPKRLPEQLCDLV